MKPQRITIAPGAPRLDVHTGETDRAPAELTVMAYKVAGRASWRFLAGGKIWSVPEDYVTVLDPSVTIEYRIPTGGSINDGWQRETVTSKEKAIFRVKALRHLGCATRFVTE